MMQIESAKAFELPYGSFVMVKASEGGVGIDLEDVRIWKSVDLVLVDKDGFEQVLCAVDYEDGKGLRTIVFDDESDEPVFICKRECRSQ